MLTEIHQQFIAVVKEGRGNRLKETPETFSGLFWSGEAGIRMGLADGLGSMDYVAREVIKEPNIVDFTSHEDFADRVAKRLGASMTQSLFKSVSLH